MAKKKKLQPQAAAPMTRGQVVRAQQEQKKIRNLYTAAIAIGTLVLLVIGLAVITTFILHPNQQVAQVNNTVITRGTYEKLRRYALYQTMENNLIQNQFSTAGGSGVTDSSNADRTALLNVSSEPADAATVSQLIDAEVLRQASTEQFKMNPSHDDLKNYALKDFEPQPTPPTTPEPSVTAGSTITTTGTSTGSTPTRATTPTATPSATVGSPTSTASPSATLPPVPGAEKTAETTYSRYVNALSGGTEAKSGSTFCQLGCPGISESDYLSLVVEPQYRQVHVLNQLAASQAITDVEQIHVQHILTDTQEGANKIKAMLDKGADFTQLANTQSKEQLDNIKAGRAPNGGDLGWTSKDDSSFVPEFTKAAFEVPTGKYSGPVKTSFGYHIIKVLARDPKRPLPADVLSTKKTRIYNEWFSKAKDAANIVPKPTPTPLPPTPVVVEPTLPPAAASPATGSASPTTPAASGSPATSTSPVATPTK